MKNIKRLIVAIMIMVVMAVPVNIKAASLVQARLFTTNNSSGIFVAQSAVKNISGTRRYTTNHLYEYNRDNSYNRSSSIEIILNSGSECATNMEYSSFCKYRCRGSVYNSATPTSGYADDDYDSLNCY